MEGTSRPRRIAALRRRLFLQPAASPVDPGRRSLYRLGAICIGTVGLLYFLGLGLSIALGPAPSSDREYLIALAGHPTLARINFAAFSLVDVLLLPAALALYQALKTSSRRLLLVASVCFAINFVVDLGITELSSFALVGYAEQYAAATTEAGRAAVLARADTTRALLPPATLLSFVVSSFGYLLAAIGTYRALFRKAIGIVGIVGSLEGIAAGLYVLVPPLAAFLLPCLATVGLWAVFVGVRLFRLTRSPGMADNTLRQARPRHSV